MYIQLYTCKSKRAKRNIRGDWRQEDNTLPSRVLTEALPTDVAQGVGLTKADLDMMLQGYYRSQGIIVAVDRSSVCSAQQPRPRACYGLSRLLWKDCVRIVAVVLNPLLDCSV